jgi:hypothetical protein
MSMSIGVGPEQLIQIGWQSICLLFNEAYVALKSVHLVSCSRYGRILRQYRVTSRRTVMSGMSEAIATVVVSDRVGRTSLS